MSSFWWKYPFWHPLSKKSGVYKTDVWQPTSNSSPNHITYFHRSHTKRVYVGPILCTRKYFEIFGKSTSVFEKLNHKEVYNTVLTFFKHALHINYSIFQIYSSDVQTQESILTKCSPNKVFGPLDIYKKQFFNSLKINPYFGQNLI